MSEWHDSRLLDEGSYRERIENALKYILLPRIKRYLDFSLPDDTIEKQGLRLELKEIIQKIDSLQILADKDTDW